MTSVGSSGVVGQCGLEEGEYRGILYFRFSIMNQTKSIFIKPSPHCKDDPNPTYPNIKYCQNIEQRYSDWKIRLH